MLNGIIWCRRCGCAKLGFEKYWKVPLDRARDMSSAVVAPDDGEPATIPDTGKPEP